MMEHLRRTQIYLPDELTRELDVVARFCGVSRAEVLRRAAREFVERELPVGGDDDPIWGIVGMFEGEPGNVAEEHDKYLADLNAPPTD
jgi:metal-responsive CopG/Arc/MetJ family transcriptional regulator